MAETLRIEVVDAGTTQTGSAATTRPGIPAAPRIDGRGRPGGSPSTIPMPGIDKAAATGNVAGVFASIRGGAMAALGPFGIAVTAITGAFTAAAVVVRKFGKVVENQVGQLAGLSGPVAAAAAMTEVDRLMGQIRRAQRIGPEVARAERLRSKFESAVSDLGTEILAILLELAEMFRPFLEFMLDGMNAVVELLSANTKGAADILATLLSAGILQRPLRDAAMRFFRRSEEDQQDEDDPFNRAFESIMAAADKQTELDRQIVIGRDLGIDVGA